MNSDSLNEKAIEVAAKAAFDAAGGSKWEQASQDYYRDIAKAALTAALPHLQGWQPIESLPEEQDGQEVMVGCWVYSDAKRRLKHWSSWTVSLDGGSMGCDGSWGDKPTHFAFILTPPEQTT